jgi:hypothetical protein
MIIVVHGPSNSAIVALLHGKGGQRQQGKIKLTRSIEPTSGWDCAHM